MKLWENLKLIITVNLILKDKQSELIQKINTQLLMFKINFRIHDCGQNSENQNSENQNSEKIIAKP